MVSRLFAASCRRFRNTPHALADHAPVRLQLALTWASCAHTAAEPLEVLPKALLARVRVLHLRQLHLQLSLRRLGMQGEDVEDDPGAVHHARIELVLQMPLLAGCQVTLSHHHVGLVLLHPLRQFLKPPLSQIQAGIRALAALHHAVHDGGPRGTQQFAHLSEAVRFLDRGTVERCDEHRLFLDVGIQEQAPVGFLIAPCPPAIGALQIAIKRCGLLTHLTRSHGDPSRTQSGTSGPSGAVRRRRQPGRWHGGTATHDRPPR